MIGLLASLFLASTVATGSLTVCETQQQIERLSHLIGYQQKSAINIVNVEVKNPRACAAVNVAYIPGVVMETIREGDDTYIIQEVLVVGLLNGEAVVPFKPTIVFGLIRVDERKA